MYSVTLHRKVSAKTDVSAAELPMLRAQVRARTRHYERHVLAWYALGRVHDARAARAAIHSACLDNGSFGWRQPGQSACTALRLS